MISEEMLEYTIGQRFTLFIKKKNISQKIFSKTTSIAEKTVSNIANDNTRNPKSDFFAATLRHYPELSIRWLILGEGEMWLPEGGATVGTGKVDIEKELADLKHKLKDYDQIKATVNEIQQHYKILIEETGKGE